LKISRVPTRDFQLINPRLLDVPGWTTTFGPQLLDHNFWTKICIFRLNPKFLITIIGKNSVDSSDTADINSLIQFPGNSNTKTPSGTADINSLIQFPGNSNTKTPTQKLKVWIFDSQFPGNRFMFGIILNDFRSSTFWANQA